LRAFSRHHGSGLEASYEGVGKEPGGKGLWLEDIPEPVIGINDVLIRVRYAGICGTDVHIYQWDDWAQKTINVPMAIGHEFVGEVVQVGSNVNDFFPGDIVSGEGHVVCGRCRNCMAGRRHLCANTQGVGVNRAGAFAEYIALPMTNIWRHHAGIDQEVAAIFDPFGNAVHTALSFPVLGEDVLITGAGPIGIMAIPVVRHAGARHIVITDMNPVSARSGAKMGATLAINPAEISLREVQKQLGMSEGFDVGLEMSGNPAGAQRHDRQHEPRRQDRHPRHPLERDAHGLAAGHLQHDHHQGHLRPRDVRHLVQNVGDDRVGLDISPVITHRFAFEDFQQGFDAMISGQTGKVVLDLTALYLHHSML
jgi:threonine 3-dehydrogenase